eukprot:2345593-Prymnesium_polylepis.1
MVSAFRVRLYMMHMTLDSTCTQNSKGVTVRREKEELPQCSDESRDTASCGGRGWRPRVRVRRRSSPRVGIRLTHKPLDLSRGWVLWPAHALRSLGLRQRDVDRLTRHRHSKALRTPSC